MKIRLRLYITLTIIALSLIFFSECVNRSSPHDPRQNGYVGAAQCIGCHKNLTDSFFHTAHFESTRMASGETIAGSFAADSNTYHYTSDVKVIMERENNLYYQAAYKNDTLVQKQSFDIVVGSGRKAQTYLYWLGEEVLQLPVSYFVPANKWANSPNYPAHQVRFDRNIPVQCFECHGSYIKRNGIEARGEFAVDHFDRNQVVYGIDCERCHGPGEEHVAFHQKNPEVRSAKFIIPYKDLTRQKKLDMCSVCHSGIRENLRSTFYFRPGTNLNDFMVPDTTSPDISKVDVHGNQYQLLAASKCFLNSQLTCATCHNTHVTERDNMALFSKKCMSCHTPASDKFCKLIPKPGIILENNCVDCHMPEKVSRLISLQSQGDSTATPNKVRTHFISIYQSETNNFIKAHGLNY